MTRRFYQAAIATLATAIGFDAAIKARQLVGPQHDLSARACLCGTGIDAGYRRHLDFVGMQFAALALIVTADQHRAAAARTLR